MFFLPLCQLMDINESPVYVLLNPTINHAQKDLPISIFESGKLFCAEDSNGIAIRV